MDLDGRVALVTGANTGIGAATATALAGRGASVLVGYFAGDADEVLASIRAAGGRAEAVPADLRAPEAAAVLFDAAESGLGPVAILVNNATGWRQDSFLPLASDDFGRPLEPVTAETFAPQFEVDARATALLIAEFARRHIDHGGDWGRIVSLTSSGRDGFPTEVSYGAAKAALESYTLSAALELGRYGITANVVHPPITDTGWVTDEIRAAGEADSPLRHIAEPADVAEVIGWLCSPAAGFVTGNVIRMR
jgi:3-oxoacyl-[acyl-carrier protein] reductase